MRLTLYLTVCSVVVLLGGCGEASRCKVTMYGANHMTYTGSGEQFNSACRNVLHELSEKEDLGDNRTRYPSYGEGVSATREGDRPVASRAYLKTKDADGAEYKITTITLGKRDPIVILESSSSDTYKLVNALNEEFRKRGIRVKSY